MSYIELEAAVTAVDESPCWRNSDDWFAHASVIEENLRAIPAVDVRPVVKAIWKHVQWVVDEEWQEGGYWISRCSNCSMPYHTETPFCPHCGADMRPEKGK